MIVKYLLRPTFLGVLVCVFTSLSSCHVARDISRPDLNLPISYRGSQEVDSVTIMPWKQMFGERYLLQLIDTALFRNADLNIAIKNIEAASLIMKQSKLGYLPTVGININATSNRPSNNSLNGLTLNQFLGSRHVEDYSASALLSWEADIWGKVRNQKAGSLASFLQTGEAKKAIQTQLIADVSKGYYNLLMLDTQLEIARENAVLSSTSVKIIKLQYEAGQVSSLAVQQAQAQQLVAQQLIPVFQQEIAVQENAICRLLGVAPAAVQSGHSIDSLFPLQHISAGIPANLLALRPDIRMAELQLDRASAQMGIERSNMYPALTITAQGGLNSFQASNWFNIPASLFGNVMGGLTQPIFQRRKLRTRYELSKIEREKSVIAFRQQVIIAVVEVSDALTKIEKVAEQRSQVDLRTKILFGASENADLLFKNGMANYLEVILARSNVLQSELQSAELKRAQLYAAVDLYRSIGGGWK